MNFDERFITNLSLTENLENKKTRPFSKEGTREIFTPAVPPTLVTRALSLIP